MTERYTRRMEELDADQIPSLWYNTRGELRIDGRIARIIDVDFCRQTITYEFKFKSIFDLKPKPFNRKQRRAEARGKR